MKKRDLFPVNEMDLKSSKIVILSYQYKNLEIRKCHSMTLTFAFNIPQIVSPGTYTDSRICVDVEKCHFSSLQNILNCQTEYPLKTVISVRKFNECLIEKHSPISKFYSQNFEIESLILLVYAMKELDWWPCYIVI